MSEKGVFWLRVYIDAQFASELLTLAEDPTRIKSNEFNAMRSECSSHFANIEELRDLKCMQRVDALDLGSDGRKGWYSIAIDTFEHPDDELAALLLLKYDKAETRHLITLF